MAVAQYVVLTTAKTGRQDEFERWYDELHLDDVVAVEGVIKASRFRIVQQDVSGIDAPQWCSLAIYEIEADNPQEVVARISATAGTMAMPTSEAMSRDGLVKILASKVSEVTARPTASVVKAL